MMPSTELIVDWVLPHTALVQEVNTYKAYVVSVFTANAEHAEIWVCSCPAAHDCEHINRARWTPFD